MFIKSVYHIKDSAQNMFLQQKYTTDNKNRDFNRTNADDLILVNFQI